MKLTVLVDNNTYIDQYYFGEPAVSYYIEDGDERILFDTGYSDIIMKNSDKLPVDLSKITKIVFSHGHNDHTGGFRHISNQYDLANVELIAHPDALKIKKENNELIGLDLTEEAVKKICRVSCSKVPMRVSDNIIFLGEIPNLNSFERRTAIGKQHKDGCQCDDFVLDDTALVYKGKDGLFIITGCSHSGICNIIEYAKKVCNNHKVLGIIGGFHLFDVDSRLNHTIEYFVQNDIRDLYPCHCVSFQVKAEINSRIPIHEVGVGLSIDIKE